MSEQDRIDELHRLIVVYQNLKPCEAQIWYDGASIHFTFKGLAEDERKALQDLCMSFQEQFNQHMKDLKKRYEEAIYNFNKTPQP